ncbi:hypothetical protein [Streptomyces aureocirculatus]|uniref:hypothetical protein n=1 Tax=Streptomyces aureocirculatus TaxID=67275 RepID=UPI0004C9FC55|nr:hypothetical protein [Streptomyces aureocirculatus]
MQNKTYRRRCGAAVAALVAAAIVGTGLSGSAMAVDHTQVNSSTQTATTAPLRADVDLSGVSDGEGEAAIQRAVDVISSIPESLIKRVEAGDQNALREVVELLDPSVQAKPGVQFGWFGCATAVAKFAAENGIGIAKACKLVKNGKKVVKAIWAYIKHGKYPVPRSGHVGILRCRRRRSICVVRSRRTHPGHRRQQRQDGADRHGSVRGAGGHRRPDPCAVAAG